MSVRISESEFWAAVDAASTRFVEDEVPSGAKTLDDLADYWKIPRHTAEYRLDKMIADGGWMTGKKHAPGRDGRVITQRFYWPKSKPKE